MKIRVGFVSNSSSSSFLVIGKNIAASKVTTKMLIEKQIVAIGGEVIEGLDVFEVKSIEEMAFLKALANLESEHAFTIVDACVFGREEYEGEIEVKNLPRSGKVSYYTGWMDYSSSQDVSTLKERYDSDGKVSRVMQRYLRAKKIKKLNINQLLNREKIKKLL